MGLFSRLGGNGCFGIRVPYSLLNLIYQQPAVHLQSLPVCCLIGLELSESDFYHSLELLNSCRVSPFNQADLFKHLLPASFMVNAFAFGFRWFFANLER